MKAIPVSIVLAGLMIPAAVLAQPELDGRPEKKGPERRQEGPKGEGMRERGFGKGWKEADADNSGTITREEFGNFPRIQKLPEEKRGKIFNRIDKDKDGVLNGEELKQMMRPPHGEGGREAMMRFRELDTDKSGGVSLVELKAGGLFKKLPVEKQEALFARLDTDNDGQITVKDRPPGPPRDGPGRPGRPDREGKADREEGKEGRPDKPPRDPRRMLKDLDEDQNGSISFEEFRKAPPHRNLGEDEQEHRFEAIDQNHDKKLDEADFPPLPPKPEPAPPAPAPAGGE